MPLQLFPLLLRALATSPIFSSTRSQALLPSRLSRTFIATRSLRANTIFSDVPPSSAAQPLTGGIRNASSDPKKTGYAIKTTRKPKIAKPKPGAKPKKAAVKAVKKPKAPLPWTPPPKRPSTPLALFITETLRESPKQGHRYLLKELSASFAALSDVQKQVYMAAYHQKAAKYRAQYAKWEAEQSPAALRSYIKTRRAKYRKRAASRAGRLGLTGLKRPAPVFALFLRDMHASPEKLSLPAGLSLQDIMKAASAHWKDMSLGQKAPYVATWEESRNTYLQERAALLEAKLKQTDKPQAE